MPKEPEKEEDLNPKKRGLGRGLGALFEDEEGVYPQADQDGHTPGVRRLNLPITDMAPGEYQPRQEFEEKALFELAGSIKEHGLLQPILVRPMALDPDRYEIVAGERRWRAAQIAQLHEVPVIIRELDDSDTLQIALIENLHREDLDPIEEALGYQRLVDDFDYTAESVGAAVNKSRSHVTNILRLLQLPENVQKMVRKSELSAGHARALITADDPEALARKVVRKNLSVRQTEQLAAEAAGREIKARPAANKNKSDKAKDVDTLALEAEVSNVLGMKVSINMKDTHRGVLNVHFSSLDQLDEALRRLSQH